MTVENNPSRNQYTATAGQTIFAYTFEVVAASDLVVLENDTTLVLNNDYTVSGVGDDNGGNVTLTTGATAGDILTIYRDMPYDRTQNYQNAGDFLASEVNTDFDRLWLAGEQTNRTFEQSIRKPVTDLDSVDMELPSADDRANKYLAFDSAGQPLALETTSGIVFQQGEWTPTLVTAGGAIESYAVRDSGYVRIGNLVFLQCTIDEIEAPTATGAVSITGVPYSVAQTDPESEDEQTCINSSPILQSFDDQFADTSWWKNRIITTDVGTSISWIANVVQSPSITLSLSSSTGGSAISFSMSYITNDA